MSCPGLLYPLLALAVMASSAQAPVPTPESPAAVRTPPTSRLDARQERPEYVVVFWYDRSRPVDTFQYQVYDVRKGEFSPAVRAWLSDTAKRFPGYAAYARELRLDRVPGRTERLKVGRAITDELWFLVGAQGGPAPAGAGHIGRSLVSGTAPVGGTPTPPGRAPSDRNAPGLGIWSPVPGGLSGPGLPGDGRPIAGPGTGVPPYSFPTPFPYPRPHP